MTSTQTGYIIIMLFGLLMLFLIAYYLKARNREKADKILKKQKKSGRNYLYTFYRFFDTFPLTKRYYRRYRNRLQALYPADDISVNLKATKTFLTTITAGILVAVVTIVVADGDLFFVFAGFTMTYILVIALMNGSIERMERKLLYQFKDFIDMVREQYNKLNRVDDAVANTLDRLPYEMGLHATILHQVLISTNVEKAVDEYVDKAPNRFFMTFAAIAATTVEYGDKVVENGSSLFLRNINFLKEEVNIELLKQQKNNALFSGLSFVTLLPIFAVKPIEKWAITNMPDMATYYKGTYGIVCMAIVFVMSAVAYTLVGNLKNAKPNEVKETSVFKTVAEFPPIQRVLNGQVNRNYSKALRYDEMLRFTGDHLGVNTFLLKRYVTGIAIGIVTLCIMCSSVVRQKANDLSDFDNEFSSSIVADEEYRQTMRDTAELYTKEMAEVTKHNADGGLSEDELTQTIMENSDVKDEDSAKEVAQVVIQRNTALGDIYFKWWYLLAVFGTAMIGYMVPLWMLMFQQAAVKMNMEDEVSQFQTICLMLVHVDGANTTMLLEWMERFASCFKQSISQCIIDLPHDGQKALEKMRDAETFDMFQSFVNNMLSIDNVGIEKAFSSIETDRQYYKEKRQADNNIMMERKAGIGKWVAMAPLVFVFGFYLIYPMVKMAMSMMNQINQAM